MDELLIGDLEFALAKQLVGCTKLQVTTLNERLCCTSAILTGHGNKKAFQRVLGLTLRGYRAAT